MAIDGRTERTLTPVGPVGQTRNLSVSARQVNAARAQIPPHAARHVPADGATVVPGFGGGASQTRKSLHIFNNLITINCVGDFFPVR